MYFKIFVWCCRRTICFTHTRCYINVYLNCKTLIALENAVAGIITLRNGSVCEIFWRPCTRENIASVICHAVFYVINISKIYQFPIDFEMERHN